VALGWATRRPREGMEVLRVAFTATAEESSDVVRMGRTQHQDTVPMTLGQEFGACAIMIGCIALVSSPDFVEAQARDSVGLATALTGDAGAPAIAQEAAAKARTVYDVALAGGLLTKEQADDAG
jgi:aspartate ammonia-lyase